jgi:nucleoside-diphosphate-sugar epimerase
VRLRPASIWHEGDVTVSESLSGHFRQAGVREAPFTPTNPYERSKAAAERVAVRGLPVVVARPGFIYGPGDKHVFHLFRSVQSGWFSYIGGGEYLCLPTFVADAVAGMLVRLHRGRVGEVYHFAGPRPVSFRELAETIAAAVGTSAPRWRRHRARCAAYAIGWTPPLVVPEWLFFPKIVRSLGKRPSMNWVTCQSGILRQAFTVSTGGCNTRHLSL